MKRFLLTTVLVSTAFLAAKSMSYEQARDQALYLTDKMAYELNLTDQQWNEAYEINLDYLMNVTTADDVYGPYWSYRNDDLRVILYDWQWTAFTAVDYFFRPLVWATGGWYMPIYTHYDRGFFFYSCPNVYYSYCGGHGHFFYAEGFYCSHRGEVWHGGMRGVERCCAGGIRNRSMNSGRGMYSSRGINSNSGDGSNYNGGNGSSASGRGINSSRGDGTTGNNTETGSTTGTRGHTIGNNSGGTAYSHRGNISNTRSNSFQGSSSRITARQGTARDNSSRSSMAGSIRSNSGTLRRNSSIGSSMRSSSGSSMRNSSNFRGGSMSTPVNSLTNGSMSASSRGSIGGSMSASSRGSIGGSMSGSSRGSIGGGGHSGGRR